MISFELRTITRQGFGDPCWVGVARVTVTDDGKHVIEDPDGFIDVGVGHYSPRLEATVRFNENPEEWARALMATFNAPDLAPAVIADSHPWEVPEVEDLAPQLAEGSRTADQLVVAAGAAPRLMR